MKLEGGDGPRLHNLVCHSQLQIEVAPHKDLGFKNITSFKDRTLNWTYILGHKTRRKRSSYQTRFGHSHRESEVTVFSISAVKPKAIMAINGQKFRTALKWLEILVCGFIQVLNFSGCKNKFIIQLPELIKRVINVELPHCVCVSYQAIHKMWHGKLIWRYENKPFIWISMLSVYFFTVVSWFLITSELTECYESA